MALSLMGVCAQSIQSEADLADQIGRKMQVVHVFKKMIPGDMVQVMGTVRNASNNPVRLVQVYVKALAADGSTVDQAVGFLDLGARIDPGETGDFSVVFVDHERKLKDFKCRCVVSLGSIIEGK